MIYIVAIGVSFKCPHKIHINTQRGGGFGEREHTWAPCFPASISCVKMIVSWSFLSNQTFSGSPIFRPSGIFLIWDSLRLANSFSKKTEIVILSKILKWNTPFMVKTIEVWRKNGPAKMVQKSNGHCESDSLFKWCWIRLLGGDRPDYSLSLNRRCRLWMAPYQIKLFRPFAFSGVFLIWDSLRLANSFSKKDRYC